MAGRLGRNVDSLQVTESTIGSVWRMHRNCAYRRGRGGNDGITFTCSSLYRRIVCNAANY